ncbi:MAG: response regulator [Sideroxyarcus sp.]|nr:response regulator [Sideroxyarcus sp.]
MVTLTPTANILVATDIIGDAELAKGILNEVFDHVYCSTEPDQATVDFMRYQPDVLVLAFNSLDKSERYYLSLYRLCPAINKHPHRTVVLSNKDEVKRAYELCMKDIFDDYILFWPMTYDAPRLNMSVHNALRELAVFKSVGHQVAEFSIHSRPLAEMELMLSQQRVQDDASNRAMDRAEPISPTILVVDDDEFQHKLIGKLLEKQNYNLVFAASGGEALNLLRKMQPDIILMDVMMPDMDGLEALRNLKAMPQLAMIPVIMITGKSEGQVVSDSLKAGAANFVVKPFDQATLIAKIDHALGMTKQPYPVK